jgi:hypothetical protein
VVLFSQQQSVGGRDRGVASHAAAAAHENLWSYDDWANHLAALAHMCVSRHVWRMLHPPQQLMAMTAAMIRSQCAYCT